MLETSLQIPLKTLDDALTKMDLTYLRFQDDILVLVKTDRQLRGARRRMMEVLHERRLSLSRKKTRMGSISNGFHFLGLDYLPTQTEDNTNIRHRHDAAITTANDAYNLSENGGVKPILSTKSVSQYAWFPILEPCVRRARMLNLW